MDFVPDIQIRRLTKIQPEPRIWKSPSLPSSPTVIRQDTYEKPDIPAYLTLGRRGRSKTTYDNGIQTTSRSNSDSATDRMEIEKIRSILASLDLAKYKRKSNDRGFTKSEDLLSTSSKDTGHDKPTNSICWLEKSANKRSLLDAIPPPPSLSNLMSPSETGATPDLSENNKLYSRHFSFDDYYSSEQKSSKPVNPKLKQLTEKLTSTSAPPSPHRQMKLAPPYTAPPTSSIAFWKEPLPKVTANHCADPDDHLCSGKKAVVNGHKDIQHSRKEALAKLSQLLQSTARKETKESFSGPLYSTLPRAKPLRTTELNKSHRFVLSSLNIESQKATERDCNNLRPHESHEEGSRNFEGSTGSHDLLSSKTEHIKPWALATIPKFPMKERIDYLKTFENTENRSDSCNDSSGYNRNDNKTEKSSPSNDTMWNVLTFDTSGKQQTVDAEVSAWLAYNQRNECERNGEKGNSTGRETHNLKEPSAAQEFTDNTSSNFCYDSTTWKSNPTSPSENRLQSASQFTDRGTERRLAEINALQNDPSDFGTEDKNTDADHSSMLKSEDYVRRSISQYKKSASYQEAKPIFENDGGESRQRSMTVGCEIKSTPMSIHQRRYSKKRLRGPYGEMLEQEMSKSATKQRSTYINELDFLKELDNIKPSPTNKSRQLLRSSSHSFDETQARHQGDDGLGINSPKRKTSANIPIINRDSEKDVNFKTEENKMTSESRRQVDVRPSFRLDKTFDSSNLEPNSEDSDISRILSLSTQDTRTHVVGELYETEKSYVESLQIVVKKYMKPLKSGELSGVIELTQVDEIFYKVPEILTHHETFLEVLRQRILSWDTKQKIGDVFVDVFTRQSMIETYTAFINNWKSAKEAIKSASQAKPAFAKFLEHASREHKGKLTLDALLIMPVQRIPRYELLIKELLKHTPLDHPDHRLLLQAQKEVHDLAISINQVEREALEQEQMIQKLREIEQLIEGIVDLAQLDRTFIRYDFVTIPGGLGIKKDRCLLLFSDILLITNIKKRGTAMRKTSLAISTSQFGPLEANKYKLLMRLPLQNVEITKKVDEKSVKRFLKEVGVLEGDVATLGKMSEMLHTLNCQHQILEDVLRDVLGSVSKQLIEKQTTNAQLMTVELAVSVQSEVENLTVMFSNPEKRLSWENSFSTAKENLTYALRRLHPPAFMYSVPIKKTRAGLQVTCAIALYDSNYATSPDIWVCSSDEYVGQVCVLTIDREPSLISCSTICSAKILCIVYVPGIAPYQLYSRRRSTVLTHFTGFRLEKYEEEPGKPSKSQSFQLDSDSSDDEEFIDTIEEDSDEGSLPTSKSEPDCTQAAIWIGADDGCIYVYSCDDIKIRRAKMKLQHSAAVYDIVYIDSKVIVALANGDICQYERDPAGSWNISSPKTVQISGPGAPVVKMLLCGGKLFCGNGSLVTVVDPTSLDVEHTFQATPDSSRSIVAMASSTQGIWVAIQNSPVVRLFHSSSFQELLDVNIAPAVAKMLSACDDIIRQHKSACLRISALLVCKNQLWIGTSAGVVLSLPAPHVSALTNSIDIIPNVAGIAQGHTGHVRFITCIDTSSPAYKELSPYAKVSDQSVRSKDTVPMWVRDSSLVISGGEGYEDFSCVAQRESAGRDDSTNHLLIWRV